MREIVMDTETTGLDPRDHHRIVEIGGVELFNHVPTGNVYHQYINPDRDMPEDAFRVHGLSAEFLSDKPRFADIAQEFLAFVGDARLVIHNAAFDMKFLNAELEMARKPTLPAAQALDTLAMARKKFPGSPASLDALCRRFGIDNSARETHGALLDSEILAKVYLELVGGRQPDFGLAAGHEITASDKGPAIWRPARRARPLPPRITETEKAAHDAFVRALGQKALWVRD